MRTYNDVVDAELFPVGLQLLVAVLRRAEHEAAPGKLIERAAAEVVFVGHHLVLPPGRIVLVFLEKIGTGHL